MRSQHIVAVLSLVCFVIGAIIALGASYGYQLGLWGYAMGLKIVVPATLLGIVGVFCGGLWLTRALVGNNSAAWRLGALGLVGSLSLAYVPLNHLWLYFVSPPIHDISTDIEYAPRFVAVLPMRAGATNGPQYDGPKTVVYQGKRMSVAYAQKLAYPDIKPYAGLYNMQDKPAGTEPRQILFWHAFQRAKDMGWNIVAFDEKKDTIEATTTAFWFGLVSDISIRVRSAGRVGARLDIRSKSRMGENDMGMNAAIVRTYVKSL